MEKFKTVQELQAAYVVFCRELLNDGLDSPDPRTFLLVMREWEIDGGYRLDSVRLAYQFLKEAGYSDEQIDEELRAMWPEEAVANLQAAYFTEDIYEAVTMYFEEAITLETAMEHLKERLPEAKAARERYFKDYSDGIISF